MHTLRPVSFIAVVLLSQATGCAFKDLPTYDRVRVSEPVAAQLLDQGLWPTPSGFAQFHENARQETAQGMVVLLDDNGAVAAKLLGTMNFNPKKPSLTLRAEVSGSYADTNGPVAQLKAALRRAAILPRHPNADPAHKVVCACLIATLNNCPNVQLSQAIMQQYFEELEGFPPKGVVQIWSSDRHTYVITYASMR